MSKNGKKNWCIRGIILMLVLCCIMVPVLAIDISSCTVINSPGNYLLTQSISSTVDPCMDIQSSNVVFDGNGFSITGPGTDPAVGAKGIYVNGSSVTVRNVIISNWFIGLNYGKSDWGRIEQVTAKGNGVGIILGDMKISGKFPNIKTVVLPSNNTEVIGSIIWDNEVGISFAHRSFNDTLRDSLITDNTDGISIGTNGIKIRNNSIASSSEDAIYMQGVSQTIVAANSFKGNYNGIHVVQSQENTFTKNSIDANSGNGVWLNSSHDNSLVDNYIFNNTANGIILDDSLNNKIHNNFLQNTNNAVVPLDLPRNDWNETHLISGTNISPLRNIA